MEYMKPNHLYERLLDNVPWKSGNPSVKGDPRKSVKWIDGLRGIASFLVILTHLARAWDYDLFSPRDNERATPRILQWPVLRIPWQGRIGVTIFAFLTGYVCALKPIKQSRNGDHMGSFISIAKSAFRRPPRLILPATIAMIISWVMAQFGAFIVANRSDCWWCRYAAPDLAPTFWEEILRLFKNFLSTWTTGYMAYDDHQWALLPLLLTSMLVYILLCATMFVRFRWRLLIYLAMFLYFHQDAAKDIETFQMQGVYGMFLSDLSYEKPFQEFVADHKWGRRIIAAVLACSGLFICGYPGEHPEWMGWSDIMFKAAQYIFPPEVNIGKRYTAMGVDLIILAIYISPSTKEFLSSSLLLWFGKQSFAVYLVHGTLLRTVLCWMLYGITGQPWDGNIVDEHGNPIYGDDGEPLHPHWIPLRKPWVVALCIPLWICLVYICASLWTKYVDSFCARLTQKLEKLIFEEVDEPPPSLPLTNIPMTTT
ncbi:Acyltransferase 3 [Penicillium riverlandense]|uniref:Acyltransferase 3 n=1 Tax=Penicillium riverlandense TaxID=1903569 RepID=UPI002547FD05|nr:Acyltransferase 3 [Penicillium riverlandense]KAJ5832689.1 Acyltransferase 3 [Penicillium riverlandense]